MGWAGSHSVAWMVRVPPEMTQPVLAGQTYGRSPAVQVSVGASGAIFGAAGALVSLQYLRKLPATAMVLKRDLAGIGTFVLYNLASGDAVNVDPATLSDAERLARGAHRLPDSLGAALDALARQF